MTEEIYKTPKSNLNVNENNKFNKKLKGSILAILAAWFYFGMRKVVLQFSETFSSFGGDLPAITSFSIRSSVILKYMGILSTLILVAWLLCILFSCYEKVAYKIVRYNFYVFLIILTITMFSMYLPIFQLG